MKNNKFTLTETYRIVKRTKLYQIKAIRDFGDVKRNELGGFVEKEDNLCHLNNCWIYESAKVSGDAKITENATVRWYAEVSGDAQVSGNAVVAGNAAISGKAQVSGNAELRGNTVINDHVKVTDN